MTYGEIKEKIRDLGFEENSTMKEYQTIVKNAVQRALQFLFDDVVIELKGYYKRELSTEEKPWVPVRPEPITDDTPDERVLELPDNIIELAPLLASYYVWLEDDNVKATLYWNAYDAHKREIINACYADVRGTIIGGVGW